MSDYPTKAWYVVGWSDEYTKKNPIKRKILGNEIVFYRDEDNKLVGLDAICPHRGADLSIGKVVDGKIACPFHGWQFDQSGKCVKVPSQCVSQKIPSKAKVRSYLIAESQGLVWIWPDLESPKRDIPPTYEWLDKDFGKGMRRVRDIPVCVQGPFISVVENAIDNTHPPFIHPGTLAGEPENVVEQRIVFDEDMRGYWGQLDPHSPVHKKVKGTEGLLGLNRMVLGVTRLDRDKCYFRFDLGGIVFFFDKFQSGHDQVALFMVTPADDVNTWFFTEHIRSFAKNIIVDYIIKKWLRRLNGEDVNHVEMLFSSKRKHGLEYPVSVVADTPSLSFRRVFYKNIGESGDDTKDKEVTISESVS